MSYDYDQTQLALAACVGKVIQSAEHLQDANFPDDKGWFRLTFTDGTSLIVESRRVANVGQSRGYFAKRLAFDRQLPPVDPIPNSPMKFEPAGEVTAWRSDEYSENQP